MPGTPVHDSLAPKIADAVTITSSANGTGVAVGKPGDVRVKLVVTGVVSGTNPTLDVEIQSSNSSSFASGNVSHGRFPQLTVADASSAAIHYLRAYVVKDYVRYVTVIGGTSTPTFTTVNITLEEPHYLRKTTDTA